MNLVGDFPIPEPEPDKPGEHKGKRTMATKQKAAQAAKDLIGQFKSARRVGTPLIGIQTPDQFATVARIAAAVNGDTAFIQWDIMRGFAAANEPGRKALAQFCQNGSDAQGSLALAADMASKAPPGTVLFLLNAQRHINEAREAQAVCNLRDQFKHNNRTLVLLGPQLLYPAELQSGVVTLDEPLPGQDELASIVREIHSAASVEARPEVVYRAVEAVQGLPAFAAEQVTAMSMTKDGLDVDALWERKRKQIEQTPGLSVSREGITFADLGGLATIKQYLKALIAGKSRPNAALYLDEIEKLLAGAGGDTSGVTQDQLGTLLSYMQDNRCTGVLLVGVPGSGKSAVAKATGNEAGIPTVKLDLGACKDSLVGSSEHRLREALKVVTSISNGSSIWIATCNSLANLPPELRRRFRAGLFYFDLPTQDERAAIWKVHRKRYEIAAKDAEPDDEGWTGAEIEQCTELAWRLDVPLKKAAEFVVPISQSSPDRVEALRQQADGRWLSASHPGTYTRANDAVPVAKARTLGLLAILGGSFPSTKKDQKI